MSEPQLSAKLSRCVEKFCSAHGVIPDTWDRSESHTSGSVWLCWEQYDEDLNLCVSIYLDDRGWTAFVKRTKYRYRYGTDIVQELEIRNGYDFASEDVRYVLFEIRRHRCKKNSTG